MTGESKMKNIFKIFIDEFWNFKKIERDRDIQVMDKISKFEDSQSAKEKSQ